MIILTLIKVKYKYTMQYWNWYVSLQTRVTLTHHHRTKVEYKFNIFTKKPNTFKKTSTTIGETTSFPGHSRRETSRRQNERNALSWSLAQTRSTTITVDERRRLSSVKIQEETERSERVSCRKWPTMMTRHPSFSWLANERSAKNFHGHHWIRSSPLLRVLLCSVRGGCHCQ